MRFLQAYLDDFLDEPIPHADPLKRHSRFKIRMTIGLKESEFETSKHEPTRAFEPSYILDKPTNDEPAPDGYPYPPHALYWEFDPDRDRYLETCRGNIDQMREILTQAGSDIRPGDRILDFGCATGTMIRFLREFAESGEVWGADIWGDAITFCMQNLSPPFRFVKTTTAAHLPFEDNYFDLIYCGSVFSHLGDNADAWLFELARVIRPGGKLYLTYSAKDSLRSYLERWPDLGISIQIREAFTPEQIGSDFDMLVCNRSQYMHTVFDQGFLHNKCRARFDIVSDTPNVYTFQHGLLLEKRSQDRPGSLPASIARS